MNKIFIFLLILSFYTPSAYAWCGGEDYQNRSIFNITLANASTEVNISTRFNSSDDWFNTSDDRKLYFWNETSGNVWVNLTTNGTYNISKCWNPITPKNYLADGYGTFHMFDNFPGVVLNATNWISFGAVAVNNGVITLGNSDAEILGKINFTRPFDMYVKFQRSADLQFLAFTNTGDITQDCDGSTCSPNKGYNSMGVYPSFQWKRENNVYNEQAFSFFDSNPDRWRLVYNNSYFAVYNNDTHLQTYTLSGLGIPMKPVFSDYRNLGSDLTINYMFVYMNTSVKYNFFRDEIRPTAAVVPIFNTTPPTLNCTLRIHTNLTNLAPNIHGIAGTGDRVSGSLYWNNDTTIQLWIIAHANSVSETAEIILYVNGTIVEHTSGRPIGGAESSWKAISTLIDKGSNYSVTINNAHHYEWRESKTDLDISGCNYPQNNNSLNSVIQGISVGIAFIFGLIVALAACKKHMDDHIKKFHR